MDKYQQAVKWIRESYKVVASEDELRFMRDKANTVFSCEYCLSEDEPFAHLVAAIICNNKNMHFTEIIRDSNAIHLSTYSWLHLTTAGAAWNEELNNLIADGKIKP